MVYKIACVLVAGLVAVGCSTDDSKSSKNKSPSKIGTETTEVSGTHIQSMGLDNSTTVVIDLDSNSSSSSIYSCSDALSADFVIGTATCDSHQFLKNER